MEFYVSFIKKCFFFKYLFYEIKGVDKYKPTSLSQIVGQQTDKSPMKKLIYFLTNWHTWHATPSTNKRKKTTSTDPSEFKAVLLTGPPGVGKFKNHS
jgi:replication factor C subunit 1